MTLTEPKTRNQLASDLYGSEWLNGEPYAIRRGDGDTVLLDFWSSTCVRCLHDVPRLNRWREEYEGAGLVVIGVHTPDYDFASDTAHVNTAVRKCGMSYPVVLDNRGGILAAYGVHIRPTRFLIDRNGIVRFVQRGTGDALDLERAIQSLVRESGYRGDLPSMFDALDDVSTAREPEGLDLPCGYLRGTLGNTEGFSAESLQLYRDSGSRLRGRLYLDGLWKAGRESLWADRSGEGVSSIRLVMQGGDAFAVMSSSSTTQAMTRLLLDDHPVPPEYRGPDVAVDQAGDTVVRVGSPGTYHLLRGIPEGEHAVTCIPARGAVDFYHFSVLSLHPLKKIFRN